MASYFYFFIPFGFWGWICFFLRYQSVVHISTSIFGSTEYFNFIWVFCFIIIEQLFIILLQIMLHSMYFNVSSDNLKENKKGNSRQIIFMLQSLTRGRVTQASLTSLLSSERRPDCHIALFLFNMRLEEYVATKWFNRSICSQSPTSNSRNVVSITKWKWINQNSSVNIWLRFIY